jgi:hypothetical protein
MSTQDPSGSIKLRTLVPVLGVIAALVSASAAIYNIWFVEKHSDVVTNAVGPTTITPQVCYQPPSGTGVGLGAGRYFLYYFIDTDVTLSNRGGQQVTVYNFYAWDDAAAKGVAGAGHRFDGKMLDLTKGSLDEVKTLVLPTGESHKLRLKGTEGRSLGTTVSEAQNTLLPEVAAMPFGLTWVLELSDQKRVEIPVQAKTNRLTDVGKLIVDQSIDCTTLLQSK